MLFMTQQLIENFAYQTNLYCQQVNRGNKPTGRTDVTYEEILEFIGLVIAMGLVKLPSVSDCWSRTSSIRTCTYMNENLLMEVFYNISYSELIGWVFNKLVS